MSGTDDTAVISYRLTAIERAVSSMSVSMEKLVVLEQKHIETREALARAFTEINGQEVRLRALEADQQVLGASSHCKSHGERLATIEKEMPTLKMVRGWVIKAVVGIVAIQGLAMIALVMKR